jgi:DNA-directed RNA polymerase specialized sigma24 family protein
MIETINRLLHSSRQLLKELGREPNPEEIAERMDIPIAKVRRILRLMKQTLSLETPVGDDEESSLGDFIQDEKSPSPADAAVDTDLSLQTDNVLGSLTPREEKVLRMRFGIGERQDYTLEEVGKVLGVTRERVRQIEAKAIRRLRHPTRAKLLNRAFLFFKEEGSMTPQQGGSMTPGSKIPSISLSTSLKVTPLTKTLFVLDFPPAFISTCVFFTPKRPERNSTRALFAWPSTGGAVSLTLSASPRSP